MKLGAATLDSFDEVWFADFEYRAPDGECPAVHCGVFRELRSGQTIRLFGDELAALHEAPFSIGPRTLFVSFFASAELGCFLSLGWPLPERILDLYVEFACITSGLTLPCGRGLLGALAYFGLDSIEAIEKETMRELAIRGAPFTAIERAELLAYCESDVVALAKLLPKMLPHIDLPRALLRARYMAAVARMEATGVPVDVAMLGSLRTHWKRIAGRLVAAVDVDFGVYVPTGQRTLDPTTAFGAAVVQAADEHGIDANQLAEAVDFVHHEERTARAEHLSAVQRVRQETGLTPAKIERWETTGGNDGRGRDHSTYPGWDVRSRELAARHPALGIGRGYVDGESFDDTDYGAALWSLLRELAPAATPKHHPDTILRAAKMVLDAASAFDPSSFASARPMSFSKARFAQWLSRNGIPWLQTETGDLSLADDTFREMSKAFPIVAPLRELRHALSELRLESLTVGRDGRNRCLLSPFKSKTGRNQPSNSKFIFGPSVWIRCLIKPTAGMAIAYLDWSQQEFGIAAALSGDQAMQEAYRTADPYLDFAKQAGAVQGVRVGRAVRNEGKVSSNADWPVGSACPPLAATSSRDLFHVLEMVPSGDRPRHAPRLFVLSFRLARACRQRRQCA
jgi:hypothetical protein